MIVASVLLLLVASQIPGEEASIERGLTKHPAGAARAEWASAQLVGRSFEAFGAFDARSFVETAMALGHASRFDEARRLLADIRYDGPPDDAHRNHLWFQWLGSNVNRGWVEDLTFSLVGRKGCVPYKKQYGVELWAAAARAGIEVPQVPPERLPWGEYKRCSVAIGQLGPFLSRIPAGTLLVAFGSPAAPAVEVVHHLGLVGVDEKGRRILRYAGPSGVSEEPLARYVARLEKLTGKDAIHGVSLIGLRDNSERARRLLAGGPEAEVLISTESLLDQGLAAHAPGAERLQWASRQLLGKPFTMFALGEGSGVEPMPRFRLDGFDCQTFIETSIALANAESTQEARRILDDIRYDGPIDYTHRNHYPLAQWFRANVRKGYLEDITRAVGGDRVMEASKVYDDASWALAEERGLVLKSLPRERWPRGTFTQPIVPIDEVHEVLPKLPAGTLAIIVHDDRPDLATFRVHHFTLLAVQDGKGYFRHASSFKGYGEVLDEPWDVALERLKRNKVWPVTGMAFYAIRNNREHVSGLLTPPQVVSPTE
jgi:hypothetical protein